MRCDAVLGEAFGLALAAAASAAAASAAAAAAAASAFSFFSAASFSAAALGETEFNVSVPLAGRVVKRYVCRFVIFPMVRN